MIQQFLLTKPQFHIFTVTPGSWPGADEGFPLPSETLGGPCCWILPHHPAQPRVFIIQHNKGTGDLAVMLASIPIFVHFEYFRF